MDIDVIYLHTCKRKPMAHLMGFVEKFSWPLLNKSHSRQKKKKTNHPNREPLKVPEEWQKYLTENAVIFNDGKEKKKNHLPNERKNQNGRKKVI